MTKQELNRDVKRLYKRVKAFKGASAEYYDFIDGEFTKEFKRLYYADKKFEYMNKKSVLIMLRLNVRYVVIPLHQFGYAIRIR